MKAAILFQSLSGNTRRAGELIAANLQQEGWGITTVAPMKQLEMSAIQNADMVIVGTWVHGLFVVGQAPWGIGAINHLPALRGKLAATYCTFALNPGTTLDKLDSAVSGLGAEVIGGLALHRSKLHAHAEEFAARLVANVPARA
ncbi:MAG: flavodoxin family protein [Acidimicrobiaceae bacterium]|nr:flavodoxin family protein [Acidimicrobiaceae bacterium]